MGLIIFGSMVAVGLLIVIGVALWNVSPRTLSEQERRRRIAVERLCATILAAEQNPAWVLPPAVTDLAREIVESKELNP